uniref:Sulfotransferase domain-containing protein n=1 Tax=Grammatophora oceanica TaxID=210454 RepID=A0A7S1Y722_9STRA|mmetsp:Transcript_28275/g.41643  ORF Transcript_28275/g.41643 Transcript_28275/m.41643 type:complete len:523 (+) Transcript_28275:45-1613(+)
MGVMRFHEILRVAAVVVLILLFSFSTYNDDDIKDVEYKTPTTMEEHHQMEVFTPTVSPTTVRQEESSAAASDEDNDDEKSSPDDDESPPDDTGEPSASDDSTVAAKPKEESTSPPTSEPTKVPVTKEQQSKDSPKPDSKDGAKTPEPVVGSDDTSSSENSTTSAIVKPPKTQPDRGNIQESFMITGIEGTSDFKEDYCIWDETSEWIPTGNSTAWQQRAPYVVFPGAKHCGLPSLLTRLKKHPSILPGRADQLEFYFNRNFKYYLTYPEQKVRAWNARQRMFSRDYQSKTLQADPSLISIDATSGYLFHSATVPIRLFCVAPWAKVVVMLRNPVERTWSQYKNVVSTLGLRVPFAEWIEDDLRRMKEVSLMNEDGKIDMKDEQIDLLWTTYVRWAGEAPVGRGLYSIQLQHWLGVMKALNRNWKDNVLVTTYEAWKADPDATENEVLGFLGLPVRNETTARAESSAARRRKLQMLMPVVQNMTDEMDADVRKKLEKFYRPYNKKLYKLLGWDPIWDEKKEDK